VALFTDLEPDRPRRKGPIVGWILLAAALLGIVVVAVVPAPYVIEQPGPVYNTLGEVSFGGERVPLIDIPDVETFPTEGSLDMLTVTVSGNREQLPSWIEVATAAFDPSKAVVPVDEVYPVGVTQEQSNEQGRLDMENSQREAVAAALGELGYDLDGTVLVVDVQPDLPADGVLEPDDQLVSVNGETFADVTGLREKIADNGVDQPAVIVLIRDGEEQTVELTPTLAADGETAVIGVFVAGEYQFPFDVHIQLENVGGPSAGMMFALGIIDKLTPGALNGGADVAGTGTITGSGEVGPIGGIRQKMWGALRAGADWFLAPASNCTEVVGHIPDGLTVFSVQTLDDAIAALDTIANDGDTSALPTCTS
jgi:PDZ domain-containing protein